MPSASVATTSALTGPCTIWQICLRICAVVAALLGQQRRVGGDAVDDAERHQRFDFLQIAGVDEELHWSPHIASAASAGPLSPLRPDLARSSKDFGQRMHRTADHGPIIARSLRRAPTARSCSAASPCPRRRRHRRSATPGFTVMSRYDVSLIGAGVIAASGTVRRLRRAGRGSPRDPSRCSRPRSG